MVTETREPASVAPEPVANWKRGPVRLLLDPMTWRAALYFLASFWLGLAWFVGLVSALSISLSLVLVWIGLPLLALTMLLWRGAASAERQLTRVAFGVTIPNPYRPLAEGGPLRNWRVMWGDPATWKDLGYLVLLFPVGVAEFVVFVTLWSVSLSLVALPALVAFVPEADLDIPGYRVDTVPEALPWVLVGFAMLALTLYAVRGARFAHIAFARALLGPSEKQALRTTAERLRASRARGVDAAESERRRIERDLHDGAQQRLVALAMGLGRVRDKLDTDPDAARDLLESAHSDAKQALAELRDLARGIYPAILADRGLDAALSALAARAPVRVDVSVEITDRPPAAVESIAYFVVAESLTNMAKHGEASEARVRVARAADRVVVEVTDDGVGGARVLPGGGLAGLADRAATIDGVLSVSSPPGGPTVVRAELPCEW